MPITYYLIFMLPGFLLSLYASWRVRSAYSKWSEIPNTHRVNGIQTAELLKEKNGLEHIRLLRSQGTLSDHYDPRNKSLALSEGVADQPSVASMAIAAHEMGHAMQDKTNYGPMRIRGAILPVVNIGSSIGMILVMIGLILRLTGLATVGVILFSATTLFSLVTLPIELDASKRARIMLEQSGLIAQAEDRKGVSQVLNAAALTYVAGLAASILQLLYYVSLIGGMGGRRRS